ncbi:MAG TPA: hypothetical protein DCZ95_16015 [Verrucomicrobia bacterium]|nr:MAG: hypothetical protein A2X46_06740 [Lentisphaerae bacterium GWF2_57_35]HBA85589.1 hypothetical protein [Verrucomicrobiota bacterium]
MIKSTNLKFRRLGSGVAGFLVVLGIVVAANVILSNITVRQDLTEEKLYTLSAGTRTMLAALEQPVVLKLFFNESDPQVPVMLKQYAQRVKDLLREYERAGHGNVVVEYFDPQPDSDAEDWAQRYGLAGQSLGFMGPNIYIGLVASMGENEAVLPVLDPQAENLMEYNISRLIARVENPKKPVVGVMSSLPVLGEPVMGFAGASRSPAQPWVSFKELKQDYDLRPVETTVETIDAFMDTLILVHPKNLSDRTLYALDQFVLRGGRLIAFLDPFCVAELETQASPQMQREGPGSNLDKLLKAWHVSFTANKAVVDLNAATMLRGAGNQVEENPAWLSLRKANLNERDVLTANLEAILMPCAGAFEVLSTNGLEITVLIHASSASGLIDSFMIRGGADALRKQFVSDGEQQALAVRLYGKFKTAFPDGEPGLPGTTNEVGEARTAGLSESVGMGTVVLVGDADLLYDSFAVKSINFLGYAGYQPLNDNLPFFGNSLEQMSGGAALSAIRTRGKTDRPFGVVLDLQRQAQERYMAEETTLQNKLMQAQQRLNELQAQKDQNQKLVLSPEQKKEIERFREEQYQTRQELKKVRRELRRDIEQLGVRVKASNILLMPGLVVLAGIGFENFRRRKNRRA